jgi:hypothetical protein
MAVPITPVRLGDVVKLKKPHPCGANEWEIVRVGADIGLKCLRCERRVMLVRSEFDRRFRGFLERGPGASAGREAPEPQAVGPEASAPGVSVPLPEREGGP